MECIDLQKHDPKWHNTYLKERTLILATIKSKDLVIHHVGSTAVPDLLSKPIIDIAIESCDFPPSTHIIKDFKKIGYECRGESGVAGRYWFTKGSPREVNIHYCSVGSEVVKHQILFREKLVLDERLRRQYEKIKKDNLAGRSIDDFQYAAAKWPLIQKALDL